MNNLLTVIGYFIVIVALFLIFREVMLWYWRINHIVDRLDRILTTLDKKSVPKSHD